MKSEMIPRWQFKEKLRSITKDNIKADPNGLVRAIKKQFPNSNEYVRELIANGVDAGADKIIVKGELSNERIKYAKIHFIDNGKGMSFTEVKQYLTVFESFKDSDRETVGKHGVGKLSPWANSNLMEYIVDTCCGSERTVLHMTSIRDGTISRYKTAGEPSGTTVTLIWEAPEGQLNLNEILENVKRTAEKFCRYLSCNIQIDTWSRKERKYIPQQINRKPHMEGWQSCEGMSIDGFPVRVAYRIGKNSGLNIYQGDIFICRKIELVQLYDENIEWVFDNLELMVDSHAFEIPISRNDVIYNRAYKKCCEHLLHKVIPNIMTFICYKLQGLSGNISNTEHEIYTGIILDYLLIDPDFEPASEIPLLPVIPFGVCSVQQFTANWEREKRTIVCSCKETSPEEISSAIIMIDELRLTRKVRRLLEKHFSPVENIVYEENVMETPSESKDHSLSELERRFQESLVLLANPNEIDLQADEENELPTVSGLLRQISGNGELSDSNSKFGSDIEDDIPEISFKLARLVRMDGKTPAPNRKYLINGSTITLNLYNENVRKYLTYAEKDSDLAAHWCLRELLLTDNIENFDHLSHEVREALILHDAISRCIDPVTPPKGKHRKSDDSSDSYWNDDDLDWSRFLGID